MIEISREKALSLRAHLRTLAETQNDEAALETVPFFRKWKPDTVYYLGERLQHNGKLYKVNQPQLTSSAEFPPDAEGVTALYSLVTMPGQIYPWRQPEGAHDAYQPGDQVVYNDWIWECDTENNVYPPDVYGWHQVREANT